MPRASSFLCLLLLLVPAAGRPPCAAAQAPSVEYLTAGGMPDMPFSEAVRVDDVLYLSGQIGYDAQARALVPGGIGPETKQALENIRAVLERYGSSMDKVVKCTVMLADIGEWQAMNEVYVTFFPVNRPARSALGASGLALGARVEIECLATL
jgi:reactive intermediate/imine deaminase